MCLHVAANLHILDIRTMTLDFWNMVNFEVKLFRYYEGKIMNYLKEIMWIAAFTFVGEVLNNLCRFLYRRVCTGCCCCSLR